MAAQQMVTQAMQEKAERLAEMVPTFPRGRDKRTGIEFVVVPSSDDPARTGHTTNGYWCSCVGHDRRGVCTHSLALTIYQTRQSMQRIEAAQQLRAQNGTCKGVGCIFTATTPGGRCRDHLRVIREQLGV